MLILIYWHKPELQNTIKFLVNGKAMQAIHLYVCLNTWSTIISSKAKFLSLNS